MGKASSQRQEKAHVPHPRGAGGRSSNRHVSCVHTIPRIHSIPHREQVHCALSMEHTVVVGHRMQCRCAKPGSPNDSDSSSLTPSTTDRDTSPPFSPQSKPHQTPKGLSAFHHVGDVDSDSDDYAARPYLMSGTGVANVKAAQRSARRNRQYKRRTIATVSTSSGMLLALMHG